MASEVVDEKQMEHYLLGLLPEDKAPSLEEKGLADYGFFEHLLVIENRLIDDYLAGQLSPQYRAQFEKHFLSSPKRRERVEFAGTFLRAMSQSSAVAVAPVPIAIAVPKAKVAAEKISWRERLQSFFGFNSWGGGLAAAAVMLLVAFAGWSFWEARRVREELARTKRDKADLEQKLQDRFISQQAQNEESRKELERNHAEAQSSLTTLREELAQIKHEKTGLQQREKGSLAGLISQQRQNEELRKEFRRNRAELEKLAEEAKLEQTLAQSSLTALREELAQIKREKTDLQQREQNLQAKLNSQQGQYKELRKEIERDLDLAESERGRRIVGLIGGAAGIRRDSSRDVASITLTPPRLRSSTSDQAPQLTINPNSTLARFILVLDKELIGTILEAYSNVRAELSIGGKIQWIEQDLQPRSIKADQAFVITLPATSLSAGNYQMRLLGSGSSGETVIADHLFKVVKK